jgi:hypothetical protein
MGARARAVQRERLMKGKACGSGRSSVDHLVGAGEHRPRHFEAERLSGLEIDDQFVLCRRLHGEVGGLLATKDAINVAGCAL